MASLRTPKTVGMLHVQLEPFVLFETRSRA
jgi:hypothetical protein